MRHLTILTLLVTLCACQPPLAGALAPRLICHNSNCVEPPVPEEDDTLESLEASLALVDDGDRPYIDGVEIDTFWHGEEGRCLFAHDLTQDDAIDAAEAARFLLDHIRARRRAGEPLTRRPGPFAVFVELKGHVSESKADKHTEEQRAQHLACVLDVLTILSTPAEAEGFDLLVGFTSFDPLLLQELAEALDREGHVSTARVELVLGALRGPPPPLAGDTVPIEEFTANDAISLADVHPHWVRESDYQAYDSLGWDLGFWMFSVVPETFAMIDLRRPRWVTTSEAQTLVRWLER